MDEWHSLQGKKKAGLRLAAKLVPDVIGDFFEVVNRDKEPQRANYLKYAARRFKSTSFKGVFYFDLRII